jgi:hypothetical protein
MVGLRLAGRDRIASCKDVIRVLPKPALASDFAAIAVRAEQPLSCVPR